MLTRDSFRYRVFVLACVTATGASIGVAQESTSPLVQFRSRVSDAAPAGTVPAQSGEISRATATSAFHYEGDTLVTESFSVLFSRRSIKYGGSFSPAMLKEQRYVRISEGEEGQLAAFRLQMFLNKDHAFQCVNTVDAEADEPIFHDTCWEAMKHGCCGADPYGRLFRYDGDRPFLRFNREYSEIEIPNSPFERYLGVLWNLRPDTKDAFSSAPKAIAALIYARPEGTADTVFVLPKKGVQIYGEEIWISPIHFSSANKRDEIREEGHKIVMWSLDKTQNTKAISGIKISVDLEATGAEGSESLTAEIRGDHITNVRLRAKDLIVSNVYQQ